MGDNMTQKLIDSVNVPLAPELLTSSLQSYNYNDKRSALINELRCVSGITEIAKTLEPQELYKIVLKPEGAYMQIDSVGNFQAVWRKDGKIVQHTRLKAVQPSMIKVASAIGTQFMLISIIIQLKRIEKRLTNIEKEFHNDRLSEIKAGISLYMQAIHVTSQDARLHLVIAAIQELSRGIEKTLTSLKQQINDTPDIKIGFFDNWKSNKASVANERFTLAEESFQLSLMGIQSLTECYEIIDQPLVASSILENYIEKINSCRIEVAARNARLVPYKNGPLPELIWVSYIENRDRISSHIQSCKNIANNCFNCIEIEVKPEELLDNYDEKMH